jgi:two-component system, OmpR family, sensor kinase
VLRMTSVIDNLISSSRLLDGDAELYFHRGELEVTALLHEVCQLHREVSPRASIVERLHTPPIVISGDQKLLFQAFSNLVSNAVKYSPGGGTIRVEAQIVDQSAVIVVEDKGLGIPQHDIDRLFERYFRGSNVSGIVGTGIGLYLVRTVIDLHGGAISVESKEGAGTQFSVRLPLAEADHRRVTPIVETVAVA